MNPVRVAVIGVGHLGYHHARLYAVQPDAQLVGIVDTDETNAKKAAADFGVHAWHSLDELLSHGVDAASVVVPTSAHAAVATRLLEAGIDVLVEKPIAATLADATALVETARKHNRLLQVGHIERFNGAVVALESAVKHPRFIECHRLSPYPNRGVDVSVVFDLMIHDLEVLNALVKSDVVQIDAVGVPVFSESEDIANARIRYASGCVANVTCSRVSIERMRKIRIFEDNAYMSTDYSAQEVRVFRKKPGALPPGKSPMEMITIESLPVAQEEPLKRELESFIDCVRTRKPPIVSGEEGLAALRVAQRIVDTIRSGL